MSAKCPDCKSLNVTTNPDAGFLERYECLDCGSKWGNFFEL